MALINVVVSGIACGTATVLVAQWTNQHSVGLLNLLPIGDDSRFILTVILLDAWMYLWHRANHSYPLLWRFHRMHHSDTNMDVTTATRFHLGEHLLSVNFRLGLIVVFGLQIWHVVLFDLLVIAMTQFHHADNSLARFDRWIRLLIVTPAMHRIPHSVRACEMNSNYSTILSIWDRIAATFCMRVETNTIEFGLVELRGEFWQTIPRHVEDAN